MQKYELIGTCSGQKKISKISNVHEQYEEYIKEVDWKQSADLFAEVEDEKNVDEISRLIYYGVKTLCL